MAALNAVKQVYANELSLLAIEFGSDKGPDSHGYAEVYGEYLRDFRQQPLVIVEIGLLMHQSQANRGGGTSFDDAPSLRMWREYFPQAKIVGFDIADFSSVAIPGCTTIQGDQSSRSDLAMIADRCPDGIDVLIDDALHASLHQQVTLATVFPMLNAGGLCFIEDLQYQPEGTEVEGVPLTRTVLASLESGSATERSCSAAITDEEWRYLRDHVGQIAFYDSRKRADSRNRQRDALAVLEKR